MDWDVEKNAQYHCDKHVVKMILETAQLLCGVHHMTAHDTDQGTLQIPYKLSHKNHPCAIWARESLTNYLYLGELGLELCREYTHRYGKKHKSQEIIEWCLLNKPQIQDVGFTTPPKAMPEEYKTEDVIESYRKYYLGAKKTFLSWKEREVPEWVTL